MATLDKILSKTDQARVIAAIAAAEQRTSGEIKVHIESRCPGDDAYRRAIELFERLGLTQTAERNAALIYVAVAARKFSIIGDTGIHSVVGPNFWQDAAAHMHEAFARGAFAEGLVAAIEALGSRLAERFPRRHDDRNEISDEISTDDT